MGAAKRHAQMRAAAAAHCVPMSRHRFNLYGIGSRHPRLYEIFEEASWWSSPDERIIASAGRDLIDQDFSWAVLVRDKIGRFRAVKVDCSYPTLSAAENALWQVMADTVQSDDLIALGQQGDEPNSPVDLLRLATDYNPDALHPCFKILLDNLSHAPARASMA